MGFLAGKKLLITGVLSNRSIAYGIAKACHEQGAELAFSYVGERFKDRITEFAADFNSTLIFDCDVGDDAQIDKLFADLSAHWPQFDGFVHSIGFAPRSHCREFLRRLKPRGFQNCPRHQRLQLPSHGQSGPSVSKPEGGLAHPHLPWRRAHHPELQHHGLGQSLAGVIGSLFSGGRWSQRN